MLRYKWQQMELETTVEMTKDKIAKYEEAFDKIRELTGINDINILVDQVCALL